MRLLAAVTTAALLSACSSTPGVAPMGGDRYSVSRQGATGLSSQSQIHTDALREADAYCRDKGQEMEVLNTKQARPPYLAGNFPRSEIEFRCLK